MMPLLRICFPGTTPALMYILVIGFPVKLKLQVDLKTKLTVITKSIGLFLKTLCIDNA